MGSHQVLLNLLLQQVLNTVSNSNKSALLYMQRTNIHTCIHTFTHIIHTCALKQHGWHGWLHAALNYVDLLLLDLSQKLGESQIHSTCFCYATQQLPFLYNS